MKKLFFFGVVLAVFSANAQTTVYHPFPDSNAVWNVNFWMGCWGGVSNDNYSITFSGDTIVGSQSYHKLVTPYVQSNSTGNCGTVATGYKGAIRHDAINKKVYFIPPATSAEQLLYDFTMQVGDTVRGYLETYTNPDEVVQAIDSVLIGNSYRKRWIINTCYNIDFIEGIGSTYGLIQSSPGCVTDLPDLSITCFQQNGQALYPDTNTNCGLITSVNTISKVAGEIKIFPNPSQGSFTICFEQSMNIKEWGITDMLGKAIFRIQANNQTNIKINNLPSGTYILNAIDKENKSMNRKIVSCP